MSGLLIVGAGGHGKVVADAAVCMGRWKKIAYLDDRYAALGSVLDWPVLGGIDQAHTFLGEYPELVVAIGNNSLRVELLRSFAGQGFGLPSIIHPHTSIGRSVSIAPGCMVLAQSAINADASLGLGCIINTGATVDHDCSLGEGVHISPGVHLGGEVAVGDYSWIGIGSSVIQQTKIGANVMVGAGTVVIRPIPDNVTVYGVPGRILTSNQQGKSK